MKKISPDTLKKYLEGKCTPEETAIVDSWFRKFESEPDDSVLFDVSERSKLQQRMLLNIQSKIDSAGIVVEPVTLKKQFHLAWYVKVAASLVVILLTGLGVYYSSFQKNDIASIDPYNTTLVNTSHAILRQELTDGSIIWLKPDSRITYPITFSKERREVQLSGEAFFEVAKETSRPFIITTGKLTTQVLGTSFNISAWDEAESIEVSVRTGKVAVQVKEEDMQVNPTSILLTPNQRATYIKAKNELNKEEASVLPELVIWQSTNVVFDNVKVREVLNVLNKKFGVNIQARNEKILNCQIRADFTDQNLPDILELLSKSVESTYEFENDTIFLNGEGCTAQ